MHSGVVSKVVFLTWLFCDAEELRKFALECLGRTCTLLTLCIDCPLITYICTYGHKYTSNEGLIYLNLTNTFKETFKSAGPSFDALTTRCVGFPVHI